MTQNFKNENVSNFAKKVRLYACLFAEKFQESKCVQFVSKSKAIGLSFYAKIYALQIAPFLKTTESFKLAFLKFFGRKSNPI